MVSQSRSQPLEMQSPAWGWGGRGASGLRAQFLAWSLTSRVTLHSSFPSRASAPSSTNGSGDPPTGTCLGLWEVLGGVGA